MKVLIYGHISHNLMAPFYKELKKNNPNSYIAVCGLTKPGSLIAKKEYECFDKVIYRKNENEISLNKAFFSLFWIRNISFIFLYSLIKNLLALRVKESKNMLVKFLKESWLDKDLSDLFNEFDVVNIHYLSKTNLRSVTRIKKSVKVVLSFWGSDLFSSTDVQTFKVQKESLNYANTITIHTEELKRLILIKYGWELAPKIQTAIFGCDVSRLDVIDELKRERHRTYQIKKRFKIPDNCFVVQIGYSGNLENRQLEVINALKSLKKEYNRRNTALVVPVTYNKNTSYLNALKRAVKDSPHKIILVEDYMTDEEVLALAVICDVFINVRDMDALNNSMIEALYAESFVIVGSWLPYDILRRKKLSYYEVDGIKELKNVIEKIYECGNELKTKLENNNIIIRKKFTIDTNIWKWSKIIFGKSNE